jgi:hypothetical protein
MREIGTVIALLQVSHQPQDVIRIENFAQFIAVCRTSKVGSMGTRRH